MWAGHGGTADGLGVVVVVDPGGGDGGSRSEDIDAATPVGEAGADIGAVGGSYGDGLVGIEKMYEVIQQQVKKARTWLSFLVQDYVKIEEQWPHY